MAGDVRGVEDRLLASVGPLSLHYMFNHFRLIYAEAIAEYVI
jgi:hypothetical protein